MRKSAPVRAASARERRLARWQTTRRAACVALVPWVFAFARSRPGSAAHHALFDFGIGFFVVCIAGAIATWRLDSGGTARPADEQRDPPRSADTREAARPIDLDERARWAEATLRALAAIRPTGDDHDGPDIAVLRVGAAGVELLLHAPCPVAPAPFRPSAGGLVWSLDPSVELEDLIELGQGVRLSPDAEPAPLVEIGSDEEGSYFAHDAGIVTLRLGDEGLGELHDELPSFGSGDRQATSRRLFGAPLVVVERGEQLLLEPYGIPLPVSPESPLPPPPEPAAEAPSAPVHHPEPETKTSGLKTSSRWLLEADGTPAKVDPSTRALPRPGRSGRGADPSRGARPRRRAPRRAERGRGRVRRLPRPPPLPGGARSPQSGARNTALASLSFGEDRLDLGRRSPARPRTRSRPRRVGQSPLLIVGASDL